MTEGRKAGRASKSKPALFLAQGVDLPEIHYRLFISTYLNLKILVPEFGLRFSSETCAQCGLSFFFSI